MSGKVGWTTVVPGRVVGVLVAVVVTGRRVVETGFAAVVAGVAVVTSDVVGIAVSVGCVSVIPVGGVEVTTGELIAAGKEACGSVEILPGTVDEGRMTVEDTAVVVAL